MGKRNRQKGRKNMIIVATPEELMLAKKFFPTEDAHVIGVGINAIQYLRDFSRKKKLINIGYAGSNKLDVGEVVSINECRMFHPNVEYNEPTFQLLPFKGLRSALCYTSSDFVLKHSETGNVVFDMELALICAMGFDVQSIKVVSDKLSYKDYERAIKPY